MSTVTLVSVAEYLTTAYHPDCDYRDGILEDRALGTKDHSKLQSRIPIWFWLRRKELQLVALTEQRIRVAEKRYRVPDICVVVLPEPEEQVFTAPPYIIIEILSPEDGFPQLQERLDDYLAMGVENVWILDPVSRRGWWATREGHWEALDGILHTRDGRVEMPIAGLFALDE